MSFAFHVSAPALETYQQIAKACEDYCLIFVYNPNCSACIKRTPIFNNSYESLSNEFKQHVFSYNDAKLTSAPFTKATGITYDHYPFQFICTKRKGLYLENTVTSANPDSKPVVEMFLQFAKDN